MLERRGGDSRAVLGVDLYGFAEEMVLDGSGQVRGEYIVTNGFGLVGVLTKIR